MAAPRALFRALPGTTATSVAPVLGAQYGMLGAAGEGGGNAASPKRRRLFQEDAKSPPSYVNKRDSSQRRCGRAASGWRQPARGSGAGGCGAVR